MDELEEYRERLDNMIEVLKVIKMMIGTEIEVVNQHLSNFKYATCLRNRGRIDAWEKEIEFLNEINDQLKSI